jgi:hypothetical protein
VVSSEPVLLDWLLLDAPLQHLRDNDGSWRLRVSVNGDSFITDQNVPIWLKGWSSGSNSLQLELLDGRGKPLNPPFNSLVSELVLKPSAPKPRWQLGRLSAEELASLVGQTPRPTTPRPTKPKAVAAPQPAPQPPPQPTTKPEPEPEPKTQTNVQPQPAESALPVGPQAAMEEPEPETPEPQATESQAAELQALEPQLAEPETAQSENVIVAPNSAESSGMESATTAPQESPGENGEQTLLEDNPALAIQPSAINSEPNSEGVDDDDDDDDLAAANQPTVLSEGGEEPAAELPSTPPDAPAKLDDRPNLEALAKPEVFANPDDPSEPGAPGQRDAVIPPPITNPDRLTPSTNVVGSARDQVHEDGSLIKPKRKGPLAGLRERLAS